MTEERKRLAAELFNQAWELIDQHGRTDADDMRMLTEACASRALWEGVGGPAEIAVGDWQIAHVASLLGHASMALDFANAAHETASTSGVPDWLLASTCEGVARAHAVAGHAQERDVWIAKAHEILATVADAEDRAYITSQLAAIPTDVPG